MYHLHAEEQRKTRIIITLEIRLKGFFGMKAHKTPLNKKKTGFPKPNDVQDLVE